MSRRSWKTVEPLRRLASAAVAGLLCLSLAPAAALAANECKQMCPKSERECSKNCEKDDPECPLACKQSAKACPETCAALMKHKGNPAAMGEALRESYEKQKGRRSAEEPVEQGRRH